MKNLLEYLRYEAFRIDADASPRETLGWLLCMAAGVFLLAMMALPVVALLLVALGLMDRPPGLDFDDLL